MKTVRCVINDFQSICMYIKTFSHEAHNKVHPVSLLIQSIQQNFTLSDFTNLLGEIVNNITTVKCEKSVFTLGVNIIYIVDGLTLSLSVYT